ncbi:MAG: hypothetical protein KBF37_09870 [Saprospiraceae bacterium]|jgi:ligand-binding sensor domain-containing protein|nr:hypothetical protein [Saprospiraceae bacterium]MBP9210613.1 hypothetical protein [Saprospiraceae bacterium]
MKRLAVLWRFFLLRGAADAQQGPMIWYRLGVRQGLSQASNWYVYKDSRGFVWISSVNGLNRFDGQRSFSPILQSRMASQGKTAKVRSSKIPQVTSGLRLSTPSTFTTGAEEFFAIMW